MLKRINIVLAVLLAVVVGLTFFLDTDYSRPNWQFMADMKYSPAWHTYSANPNYSDQRTLQSPVEGTIARGAQPLYYEATKEDALRAGEELLNPYALDFPEVDPGEHQETDDPPIDREAEALERLQGSTKRGGDVFRVYCVVCHGPQGAGDGPVPQRGFPPPPSLLSGKSRQMKDGQLFHILTYGQGSMAPFAGQISRDSRWDAINYIRELQSKATDSIGPDEAEVTPPGGPIGDEPKQLPQLETTESPTDQTSPPTGESTDDPVEQPVDVPPTEIGEDAIDAPG